MKRAIIVQICLEKLTSFKNVIKFLTSLSMNQSQMNFIWTNWNRSWVAWILNFTNHMTMWFGAPTRHSEMEQTNMLVVSVHQLQTICLPSHRNKFKKKRIHFYRDKKKFLQSGQFHKFKYKTSGSTHVNPFLKIFS